MPVVIMPDGTHVDMPDQAPDEGVLGYLKTAAHGAINGVAGLPAMLLDNYGDLAKANMEADLSAGKNLTGQHDSGKSVEKAVTSLRETPNQGMQKRVDQLANFVGREPQTTGEQFMHSAAEGAAGGLLGPGNMLRNAVIGASSGLGSETAAKLLQDDTPLNRVIGAIAGAALPIVGGKVLPNNAEKVIKTSVQGLTSEDWKNAKDMQQFMRDQGMVHSNAQLLGSNSTLDDVFAKATENQFVRPGVLKKLNDAPASAHEAFNNWIAGNLPPSGAGTRETLLDVQKAASDAIDKLYGKSNEAFTAQIPSNAAAVEIPAHSLRDAVAKLRAKADNPEYFGRLPGGGDFLRSAAKDLETAGKDKNLLVGDINGYLKDLNAKAYKEGYKGVPVNQVKDVLKEMTPEYDAARAAKSEFIKTQVNPVEQSLAGQLAQMGGGVKPDKYTANSQAISMVFPSNRRQPNEIIQLGKDIGADNVGKLFAEHVGQVAESTFKDTKHIGAQMQQPFDFKAAIAGTNAQRQNINAALKVVAESNGMPAKSVQDGFFKLMNAMDSYKDLKVAGGIDRASAEQAAGGNWASAAIAPFSRAGRYVQDAVMARTYRKIANMVLDKNGLTQLEAIGRAGNNAQSMAFVRSVIAATAVEDEKNTDNKPAE